MDNYGCQYAFIILLLATIFLIGSQSAGYDSVECDPSSKSRTGRARLLSTIPCDLTKQSYCNLPGSAYPWNAVKRFVYENQGLVRRMYGDLQHIFVLKSDLDHHENEISWEDIKHGADKYLKTFNSHNNERQMKANSKLMVENKNLRSNDILEQPHFRPTTNKHSSSTVNGNKLKPTKQQQLHQSPIKTISENSTLFENIIKDILEYKEMREKTENPSNIFLVSKTTKLTSVTPAAISKAATTSAKVKVPSNNTEENDAKTTNVDEIKAPDNIDKYVIDTFGNNSITSSSVHTPTTTQKSTTLNSQETPVKLSSTLKNNRPEDDEEESEEAIITEILSFELKDDLKVNQAAEEELEKDKNKWNSSNNNNNNINNNKITNNKKNSMETQLFQDSIKDSIQKDKDQQPQFNKRGVNACPVKEEVVAPFWGNNTRGEVLALLNIYPFEQYINWEKCTHEHEQMYCRDGCRCEQQYRLHRLLAYNPYDPCRGIFSDWFRFPSCCICKCYDVPFDYRVTSRSPRSQKETDETIDADEIFVDDDEDERNLFGPE